MSNNTRMMNRFRFVHRHRRAIIWLCVAATVLLGIGAQLHGLSHSLQAVQASAHKDVQAAAHAQACEQCLQFAAIDGGLAAHVAAAWVAVAADAVGLGVPVARPRATVFVAYASRAPPLRG